MRRRDLIAGASATLIGAPAPTPAQAADSTTLPAQLPDGTLAVARFANLPGKTRLIELSDRPPNYATPPEVFSGIVTPNDRFYVHYHLDGVPAPPDTSAWTITIDGDAAEKPIALRRRDLRDLPSIDILAVLQDAGNRRGLASPHVAGLQWPDGAMGCALWHGYGLGDLLKRAGIKPNALEVWFSAADTGADPGIPRYRKSLPLAKAMDPATLVVTGMNNAPLPLLNGAPARLIVPGWVGSYWVKHLNHIEISSKPLDNYWMRGTERVAPGLFPVRQPFRSQETETSVPVTELVVNSVIATPLEGAEVDHSGFTIGGVAWDRGTGINRLEISLDNGGSWQDALMDSAQGSYAFRRFTLDTGWVRPGIYHLMSRATTNTGERQPAALKANPGGYHNNVPRAITVKAR
jgi:DMSO/TMAO reductase YedYZ molybdopterin-dependent catalytic subunit